MKVTKCYLGFRITAGFLIPAMLFVPTMQAGQAVAWADLPKIIGELHDCQYRVVTKDGIKHIGYQLIFSKSYVKFVEWGDPIAREDVKEIESAPGNMSARNYSGGSWARYSMPTSISPAAICSRQSSSPRLLWR